MEKQTPTNPPLAPRQTRNGFYTRLHLGSPDSVARPGIAVYWCGIEAGIYTGLFLQERRQYLVRRALYPQDKPLATRQTHILEEFAYWFWSALSILFPQFPPVKNR